MTKKDKKELNKIASKLPLMQHKTQKEKVTISGYALIEQGQTKYKGKEIQGAQRFIIEKPRVINHKTELEKAFKAAGMNGVHSYVSGVINAFKTRQQHDSTPQNPIR